MTKITKIQSIKIENLFEVFDYNIEYPVNEDVLIITGPNGFGKTQILNILFNLFNKNFLFFHNLSFEKITLLFNNNISIKILKDKKKITFRFFKNQTELDVFSYDKVLEQKMFKDLERYLPLHRIDEDSWIDRRTDKVTSMDEIISIYSDQLPDKIKNNFFKIKSKEIHEILDSINVYLIREQRLFKKLKPRERSYNYRDEREQAIMTETIQIYSNELCKLIEVSTQDSFATSQKLDSSYPNRLISEKKKVTKEQYDEKFAILKEKQEKLIKNGLYKESQTALEYNQDDAKALFVYLEDLEKKLKVFDDLLEKLELFTSILNKRRFTFKTINISREKGFYFKTSKGQELKLNQLSSGEQHEVILLYELIFKTKQNMLVLIDEPEISLHVTWQKEFIEDLLKIIKIQKFQVLIATHSPTIINDRWDLVYTLTKRLER